MPTRQPPPDLLPGGRFNVWRPGRPRYLVADVDGTLLGSSPSATQAVVDAAAAARDAGVFVGYATGRLPAGVEHLHRQLGLSGPHVVYNGAQVRADGKPLRTWSIPRDRNRALLEIATSRQLYGELYIGEGFVATDYGETARTHWDLIDREPDGLAADVDLDAVDVVKAVVAMPEGKALDDVIAAGEALGLSVSYGGAPMVLDAVFVNFTSGDADKGKALVVAAEHVGCDLSQVWAVGDAPNDLSMLTTAGTAVAMGQAPALVTEAAHLIAPPVGDDGVAAALRAVARLAGENP